MSPFWDPPRRKESESTATAGARGSRREKTPTVGRFVVRRLLITGAALVISFACATLLLDAAMPEFDPSRWGWLAIWPQDVVDPPSTLELFWRSFWAAVSDADVQSAAHRSIAVGLVGIIVGVGIGILARLVLHARLPRWLETTIPATLGCAGALVLAWLLPAVQRRLPSQIDASSYYLHWPQLTDATPSTSWEGVLRSGLLVGLVLGGVLAVAMLVVTRGRPSLTWRQVWARLLGRWWPLQAFLGACLIQLVLLAERASYFDAGLSRWLGAPLFPGWLYWAELWLAVFWAVAFSALLLGLVTAALDPALVCERTFGRDVQCDPDEGQALPGTTP